MREFGIGLLGFGTVGAGVVAGLQTHGDLIASRLGLRPVMRGIADLDVTTDRGVAVDASLLTTDAGAVVDDPQVEIVVELIGGTGAAREMTERALKLGKPVVTANKALLAKHGADLFRLALEQEADISFGASVGGGIPVIRALREGLLANRIDSILGILNGTCNYILTRMDGGGMAFDAALAEAQNMGFAEADPGLDVDGFDTAHKAIILAKLAYGLHPAIDAMTIEGIRDLEKTDIDYARDLGYRIKLLGVIRRHGSECEVRVHPALLRADHMLASVSGVFNAVMVCGDLTGPTLYYGRGAGREPTASTVIGDIADVMRNLAAGSACRFPAQGGSDEVLGLAAAEDTRTSYYIRFALRDRPGALERITKILQNHDIGAVSVDRKAAPAAGHTPVVIVTDPARERVCDAALEEIRALDGVGDGLVRLRIEE